MKRFLKLAAVVAVAFSVSFCASVEQMAKMAALVKTESNPQVLECVANQIPASYTVKFPEKYFNQKAILKVTPVLVYNGGEMAGPDFWMQGEKIRDNYHVIAYNRASSMTRDLIFPYKEGVEKAKLELRATVYNAAKTKSFAYPIPFKVAEGTNCTYMLAKTSGELFQEEHGYQKELTEEVETQILYDVNKADVKAARLNSKEIKEFEKFLKNAKKDSKRTVKSSKIVGYASPEGPEDNNNKLSTQRAKSAKAAYDKTIAKNAELDVDVKVEEKGEDWEGFKKLVEQSNLEDKDLIIRVLSMYQDPAIREREIRNMSKVFQTLNKKVLPQLRRSRIVTNVKRMNFTDDELREMVKNNSDQLTESAMLYYAANVSKDKNEKIELLKKAAQKFNSEKALNNLAALYLNYNEADNAAKYLGQIKSKSAGLYNNLGVVQMQKGNYDKAAELFKMAKGENGEIIGIAKENLGAIDILRGDYKSALKNLEGSTCYNYGLALILNGKLNEAKAYLKKENCPNQSYLRAIIAARQGDEAAVDTELSKAFKLEKYEKRAENDIEFAGLE